MRGIVLLDRIPQFILQAEQYVLIAAQIPLYLVIHILIIPAETCHINHKLMFNLSITTKKVLAIKTPVIRQQQLVRNCQRTISTLFCSKSKSLIRFERQFQGVAAGGGREAVAAYAFVMSVPVVIGSAVVGSFGGLTGGAGAAETAVGCAAAFLTGLVGAKLALRVAGRRSSLPIAAYLFALSLLSLALELAA